MDDKITKQDIIEAAKAIRDELIASMHGDMIETAKAVKDNLGKALQTSLISHKDYLQKSLSDTHATVMDSVHNKMLEEVTKITGTLETKMQSLQTMLQKSLEGIEQAYQQKAVMLEETYKKEHRRMRGLLKRMKATPPIVHVNVPEQQVPIVNVSIPEQQAPIVHVNVPEQQAPVINFQPPLDDNIIKQISYDEYGRPVMIKQLREK